MVHVVVAPRRIKADVRFTFQGTSDRSTKENVYDQVALPPSRQLGNRCARRDPLHGEESTRQTTHGLQSIETAESVARKVD